MWQTANVDSKKSLKIDVQFTRFANLVPRYHDPLGRGTKGSDIIHLFSPTNPGDPVLQRMCKVLQDGGHSNRNRH